MNRIIGIVALGMTVSLASGCLSHAVYKDSQAALATQRSAIKPAMLDDGLPAVGVDLNMLDVLKNQPLKQILAGVGDAIIAAASLYGGNELLNSGDGGTKKQSIPANMHGTTVIQNNTGQVQAHNTDSTGNGRPNSVGALTPGIYDSTVIINGSGNVDYNSSYSW